MDRQRRSNQPPYRIQTDAPIRYLLLVCGTALFLGSFLVIWQVIASFGVGSTALGAAFVLVLLGSAYVLLSVALQRIVILPDGIVLIQWLFLKPRAVSFARIASVEQRTTGPADLLCIYRKGDSRPLRMLDLFPSQDILHMQEVVDRREQPPADESEILRRAQALRPGTRSPEIGPGGEPPRS